MKSRTLMFTAMTLLAALAMPVQLAAQHTRYKLVDSGATSEQDTEEVLAGLWHGVISSPNNSFPSFETFEQYGEGTWIGSANGDLTPPVSSTPTGRWKRVGQRKFHVFGRFWTYDLSGNPAGYGAVDVTIAVRKNGNTYHGKGTLQLFDTNGNPVGGAAPFVANATRITFPQVADTD